MSWSLRQEPLSPFIPWVNLFPSGVIFRTSWKPLMWISSSFFAEDAGTESPLSACCTCSSPAFPCFTNQILNFWRCRCRWCVVDSKAPCFSFPPPLGRTVNCTRLTKHGSDHNYHLTVLIFQFFCVFLGEDGILHTGSAIWNDPSTRVKLFSINIWGRLDVYWIQKWTKLNCSIVISFYSFFFRCGNGEWKNRVSVSIYRFTIYMLPQNTCLCIEQFVYHAIWSEYGKIIPKFLNQW